MSLPAKTDPVFRHAVREMRWIMAIWSLAFVWVVGYCTTVGYRVDPEASVELTVGMPSWVFWGIVVPWIVATCVTCVFALFRIADDPLNDSSADPMIKGLSPEQAADDGHRSLKGQRHDGGDSA